ncbi:MAG: hypothetical protein ABIQ78_03500 [Dokdonella sp.]
MKNLKWIAILVLALSGCASTPELPTYMSAPHPEINGTALNWSDGVKPATSTLSMWGQKIQGSNYALLQLRVGLDTYRFALSRTQVLLLIDAINNYQSVVSHTQSEHAPAIGWLAKTGIKLKRLGDDARDDTLIINIERSDSGAPLLVLTFESWLMTFGGADSPAGRTHKEVTYSPQGAAQLRVALEKLQGEL